eukprot:8768860-Alexandrium_andersonii.AAC.1
MDPPGKIGIMGLAHGSCGAVHLVGGPVAAVAILAVVLLWVIVRAAASSVASGFASLFENASGRE